MREREKRKRQKKEIKRQKKQGGRLCVLKRGKERIAKPIHINTQSKKKIIYIYIHIMRW